jgi:hypothetical protein
MAFNLPEQEPTPFDDVLEIARSAPRVANDDPRIEIFNEQGAEAFMGNPIMWGNNFFYLWESLRDAENTLLIEVYRNRALARTGFAQMLHANQSLVRTIFVALDAKKPADILEGKCMDLLNRGLANNDLPASMQLVDQIHEQVGHPMGITAVSLHAWDGLTPLLQEIAGRMDEVGISYAEFCG